MAQPTPEIETLVNPLSWLCRASRTGTGSTTERIRAPGICMWYKCPPPNSSNVPVCGTGRRSVHLGTSDPILSTRFTSTLHGLRSGSEFRLKVQASQIVRGGEMGQMEWNRVLLLVALLVTATAVPGAEAKGRGHRKGGVLKGVNLSFPPFTSALNCSYDGSVGVGPEFICTPSGNPPPEIAFSFDDAVVSVRYAYNKKVQLYKKNSPYAVSFSTSYVIKFQRGSDLVESEIFRLFGGGFAFAITPYQNVGKSDRESLGLFEIDTATGNALHPKKSKTIAVEIDTSREFDWDPTIPHLGLDLNSVHSVVDTYLGDVEHFVDRRIAVFIDYDARREFLAVRLQFLADAEKPNKKYAKLRLSYHGLKLSDYVNEKSIVGFSARVPQTESGTYDLTEWKFKTSWVRTSKWH